MCRSRGGKERRVPPHKRGPRRRKRYLPSCVPLEEPRQQRQCEARPLWSLQLRPSARGKGWVVPGRTWWSYFLVEDVDHGCVRSDPSPRRLSALPHAVSWSDSSRRTSWRTRERPNRHGHVARARSSGRPTSLTRRLDDQGVPFRTITAIFASVWVLSELQGTEVDKKDPAGYEITEKSNNKSSEVWQGYQHAAAVAAEG